METPKKNLSSVFHKMFFFRKSVSETFFSCDHLTLNGNGVLKLDGGRNNQNEKRNHY